MEHSYKKQDDKKTMILSINRVISCLIALYSASYRMPVHAVAAGLVVAKAACVGLRKGI